ncbi:MAG: 7,8-didemethyl-8-hydroxy-5-deazariboflavin synthase subunit CofG [Candidatus Nitrosotenuis sp.]
MSDLVLTCEPLNHVLDGKDISKKQAYEIFEQTKNNTTELYKTASLLRNKHKSNNVTFSKKAFFNLVNLCRDVCGYCTYKAEPGEQKLSLMSKKNVHELVELAKKYHCTEALFVTGERPEEKYSLAREWLRENGFSSTAEYLVHASEIALASGLFPHTNAGNLTKSEINSLKNTNVSMGLMLENSSERLTEKKMPHNLAPSKSPKARLRVLENAGELAMPMTTGILVGIGEEPYEIIDSLFAIKQLHDRFGHIQEIILQNFQPKQDTMMKNTPSAEENYFKTMVALARIIMPQMNIQIPPNLSPDSYQYFLDAGINDWGGISPLTADYVNPEFGWPQIDFVEKHTNNSGFMLRARFPVYPEMMEMIPSELYQKMTPIMDKDGFVTEEYWR